MTKPIAINMPATHVTKILRTSGMLSWRARTRGKKLATSNRKIRPLNRPLLLIKEAAANKKPELSMYES
jgi:hypothetical protein